MFMPQQRGVTGDSWSPCQRGHAPVNCFSRWAEAGEGSWLGLKPSGEFNKGMSSQACEDCSERSEQMRPSFVPRINENDENNILE